MKALINFIKSLLPSFDKRQITEDLKVTRDELDETLSPLRAAAEFFGKRGFKSKEAEDMQKRFVKEMKEAGVNDNRLPNFVVAAARVVEAIDTNLSTVERLIDRYFSEDVLKEGMTYTKAGLLRYVEFMTFSIRFARHLVLWTYQVESHKVDSSSQIELTRAELKWLEDNVSNFYKLYPFLTISKESLEKTIANIPDALITEDNILTMGATVGYNKLDPFSQNLIVGTRFNIIYHARIVLGEWQAERYKMALEERQALELRLLRLKSLEEGQRDAKLEKHIEYIETRLSKLKAKILKTEEELND